MSLSITILPSPDPERTEADVPVYALGQPVVHAARFESAPDELTLDDPRTSQASLLTLRSHARRERALFELNPSSIDITGEITAPVSHAIVLQPGQPIDVPLALLQRCGDWCLVPGWFEIHVEYREAVAVPLRFGIELAPPSVPALIELALAPDTEPWTQRHALGLLARVPNGPGLLAPSAAETAAEAAARQADNRVRADAWLVDYPERLQQPELEAFFAREQLRDPPPAPAP